MFAAAYRFFCVLLTFYFYIYTVQTLYKAPKTAFALSGTRFLTFFRVENRGFCVENKGCFVENSPFLLKTGGILSNFAIFYREFKPFLIFFRKSVTFFYVMQYTYLTDTN